MTSSEYINLLVELLGEAEFWGELQIQFKKGHPTLIKKVETFPMNSLNPEVASRKNHSPFHDKPEGGHGLRYDRSR